jgi:phytoene dehydrogenase-like protein
MSGEVTRPGFVHDLYSMNQNLFLSSPVSAELGDDLARHGLQYRTSSKPYSNVFLDGKSLRVYNDEDRMMRLLHDEDPNALTALTRAYRRCKDARALALYPPAPSDPETASCPSVREGRRRAWIGMSLSGAGRLRALSSPRSPGTRSASSGTTRTRSAV